MNDIGKYLQVIENASENGTSHDDTALDDGGTVSKMVSLIENAQRVDESFKDAKIKFVNQSGDKEAVAEYINKFKDLAKRDIIKADDKDIGKWIKGGWEQFSKFVDSHSETKSKREQSKEDKSDSIVVHEDSDKMVVIPLSVDASCYYGKQTQWCTAATSSTNHFTDYFGQKEITLFYILRKDGAKFAVAYSHGVNSFEAFDDEDASIDMEDIEEETGVTEDDIRKWYTDNSTGIEASREEVGNPLIQLGRYIEQYKAGSIDDDAFEERIGDAIEQIEELDEMEHSFPVYVKNGVIRVDVDEIIEGAKPLMDYATGEEMIDGSGEYILDPSDIMNHVDDNTRNRIYTFLGSTYSDEIRDILMMDEDDELTVEVIESNFDEIIQDDVDDSLTTAFKQAERDAEQFGTEAVITRRVDDYIIDTFSDLNLNVPDNTLSIVDEPLQPISIDNVYGFVEALKEFELKEIDGGVDYEIDHDSLGNAFIEALNDVDGL